MGAITGFGKAYLKFKKAKAAAKMKAGKSTREERLQFGKRDPDIKKVPMSKTAKKGDVKESVRVSKQHFYLKNIDEAAKHHRTIDESQKAISKAKKGLKKMVETKRAFKIGDSVHPSNPATKNR
tara:strand:- start:498 stop:869 length:372 start_codon:yes stop_codon:yes gene_type:complete